MGYERPLIAGPHGCVTVHSHNHLWPALLARVTHRLAAQLARTEEAAKRALIQTDSSAKGGAAQKLLDAERSLQKLRNENGELASKLAR